MIDEEKAFYSFHGNINDILEYYRTGESIFNHMIGGPEDDEKQEPSFGHMLAMLCNCIVMGHVKSVCDFKELLNKARQGDIENLELTVKQKAKIFDILISNRKTKLLELFIDVGVAFGCGPKSSYALANYKKAIRMGDLELIKLFERKNVELGESKESKFSLVFQLFKMVQKPGKEFSPDVLERMTIAKAIWRSHIEEKLDFRDPDIKLALIRKLNLVVLPTRWQRIEDNCRTIWFVREQGILFDHSEATKLASFAIEAYMFAIRGLSQIKVEILAPEQLTRKSFVEYFRLFGKTTKESFKIMRKPPTGYIIYENPGSAMRACHGTDPRFKVSRNFGRSMSLHENFYVDIKEHSEDMIEYLVAGGLPVMEEMYASRSLSKRITKGLNTFALSKLSDGELQKLFGVYPDAALAIIDFVFPRTRMLLKKSGKFISPVI